MLSIAAFVVSNSKVTFTKSKVTKAASNYIKRLRNPTMTPTRPCRNGKTTQSDKEEMECDPDMSSLDKSRLPDEEMDFNQSSPLVRYVGLAFAACVCCCLDSL